MSTPIFSKEVQAQIDRATIVYKNQAKWKQWGVNTLRQMGGAILLEGPPGTGKTILAEHIALHIRKKGVQAVSFADFGSHVPGEGARLIRKLFKHGHDNGGMTMVIDEADAVVWPRSKISGSNTWMLEIINEILVQVGTYKHLTILCTNFVEMIDPALLRRLIARIHIGLPDAETRGRILLSKWPVKYPLKPTEKLITSIQLATEGFSGANLEVMFENATKYAILEDRLPVSNDFILACEEMRHTLLTLETSQKSA